MAKSKESHTTELEKALGPTPAPIKRGEPLKLSTQKRTNAQSHERINRGYKLREDLIKQCKQMALDQNRKLYEVMEDALSEYLEKHKQVKSE